MGMRIDFNTPIDGGGMRVDLMRVHATSWMDSNDFGPGVVFSSAYLSAQAEVFQATVSGLAGQSVAKSGSFTPSRLFGSMPMIFANYQQTDGQIITPFFFNQVYTRPASGGSGGTVTTLERQECFQIDCYDLGGGNYRIDWVLYNFGPGAPLLDGIVRVRAVGKGV